MRPNPGASPSASIAATTKRNALDDETVFLFIASLSDSESSLASISRQHHVRRRKDCSCASRSVTAHASPRGARPCFEKAIGIGHNRVELLPNQLVIDIEMAFGTRAYDPLARFGKANDDLSLIARLRPHDGKIAPLPEPVDERSGRLGRKPIVPSNLGQTGGLPVFGNRSKNEVLPRRQLPVFGSKERIGFLLDVEAGLHSFMHGAPHSPGSMQGCNARVCSPVKRQAGTAPQAEPSPLSMPMLYRVACTIETRALTMMACGSPSQTNGCPFVAQPASRRRKARCRPEAEEAMKIYPPPSHTFVRYRLPHMLPFRIHVLDSLLFMQDTIFLRFRKYFTYFLGQRCEADRTQTRMRPRGCGRTYRSGKGSRGRRPPARSQPRIPRRTSPGVPAAIPPPPMPRPPIPPVAVAEAVIDVDEPPETVPESAYPSPFASVSAPPTTNR